MAVIKPMPHREAPHLPRRQVVLAPAQWPYGLEFECPRCPNDELMFDAERQWCLICGWEGRRRP